MGLSVGKSNSGGLEEDISYWMSRFDHDDSGAASSRGLGLHKRAGRRHASTLDPEQRPWHAVQPSRSEKGCRALITSTAVCPQVEVWLHIKPWTWPCAPCAPVLSGTFVVAQAVSREALHQVPCILRHASHLRSTAGAGLPEQTPGCHGQHDLQQGAVSCRL